MIGARLPYTEDPSFRRMFYLELLPELRPRGKTLIIVSPDKHYFHVADTLIQMRPGKIDAVTRSVPADPDTGVRPSRAGGRERPTDTGIATQRHLTVG